MVPEGAGARKKSGKLLPYSRLHPPIAWIRSPQLRDRPHVPEWSGIDLEPVFLFWDPFGSHGSQLGPISESNLELGPICFGIHPGGRAPSFEGRSDLKRGRRRRQTTTGIKSHRPKGDTCLLVAPKIVTAPVQEIGSQLGPIFGELQHWDPSPLGPISKTKRETLIQSTVYRR